MSLETQRCGSCKTQLPRSEFAPSHAGRNGFWCLPCRRARARGAAVAVAHDPLVCTVCGCSYQPKNLKAKALYCGRPCKDRARSDAASAVRIAEKAKLDRSCLHCGDAMPASTRIDATFCSELCNSAAHALQRKLRARAGGGKTGYLRMQVFERDGWECGICCEPVDRDLRHPDPMCGSLDHVMPVSYGGSNEISNLRLTHLRCNLSRRNVLDDDQLALIGERS